MKKKKIEPVKLQKTLVDRVVSFRIEGSVIDFLLSHNIDPSKSARQYLRETAKEQGYSVGGDIDTASKRRK